MKRKIYVASSWSIPERQEPELMYKLFSAVCCSMDELFDVLKKSNNTPKPLATPSQVVAILVAYSNSMARSRQEAE